MTVAFFVSSIGDTDLAKATITKLINQKFVNPIFLIPITTIAAKRTEDLIGNKLISRISLDEITEQTEIFLKDKISHEEISKIMHFINENKIQRAYIGVPSSNNEIPYQIANFIEIPCTIAYEYMFKPATHSFFNYVNSLAAKKNCDFAVPLSPAKNNILAINAAAKIYEIGHLSLDRSQPPMTDSKRIKESLFVNTNDELVFISGTTQPIEVDNQCLEALLKELSTGKYPNIQLRMGIHPGINNPDAYLQTLLKTCEKYSRVQDQFKIIITDQLGKRLTSHFLSNPYILCSEIPSSDIAQAAERVTQAVPGALLNEAALMGKPCYYHEESAIPYLPEAWFIKNISSFFTVKPQHPHSREELELKDTAPNLMSKLMTR